MKVEVARLRHALLKLLDHAEAVAGATVEVDADFYWFVPRERVSDMENPPEELTVGSFEEDWKEIAAIADGKKEPIGYALVWASTLLRAIGERAP